jgi:hypothetical protein
MSKITEQKTIKEMVVKTKLLEARIELTFFPNENGFWKFDNCKYYFKGDYGIEQWEFLSKIYGIILKEEKKLNDKEF